MTRESAHNVIVGRRDVGIDEFRAWCGCGWAATFSSMDEAFESGRMHHAVELGVQSAPSPLVARLLRERYGVGGGDGS